MIPYHTVFLKFKCGCCAYLGKCSTPLSEKGRGLTRRDQECITIQNIFPEVELDEKTLAMQISEAK
jgi:hypothetical protein